MSTPIDLTGVVPLPLCFTVPPTSAFFRPGSTSCESLCLPDPLSVVAGLTPTGDCYCLHVVNVTERAKLLCDQCPQGLPCKDTDGMLYFVGGDAGSAVMRDAQQAAANLPAAGGTPASTSSNTAPASTTAPTSSAAPFTSPTSSSTSTNSPGSSSSTLSTNASSSSLPQSTILGIALGCVLLFLILGGLALFIAIRRLKQRKGQAAGSPTGKQREEGVEYAGGVNLTDGDVRLGIKEGDDGEVPVAKPAAAPIAAIKQDPEFVKRWSDYNLALFSPQWIDHPPTRSVLDPSTPHSASPTPIDSSSPPGHAKPLERLSSVVSVDPFQGTEVDNRPASPVTSEVDKVGSVKRWEAKLPAIPAMKEEMFEWDPKGQGLPDVPAKE
ncbi:hypothetical protein HK101_003441 [Irineochytrium annulatum]|nr:hypothetical protein HK101_003441 [Irineochytrium annulatum]